MRIIAALRPALVLISVTTAAFAQPPGPSLSQRQFQRDVMGCNLPALKKDVSNGLRLDVPLSKSDLPPMMVLLPVGCYDDELIRLMLNVHTDFNAVWTESSGSKTILMMMMVAGDKPARAGIPAHKALDTVAMLLKNGADPGFRPSKNGLTPVDFAAAMGRTDILKLLLESKKFNPSSVSSEGKTPIHFLVQGMCVKPDQALKALQMLKAAGVSPGAKDNKGATAKDFIDKMHGMICPGLVGKL